MAEAKHTPGPWFAVEYPGFFCIQDGPVYTDECLFEEKKRPIGVAAANARLAAAAPALLEALHKADDGICDGLLGGESKDGGENWCLLSEAYAQSILKTIRAAIAAAE